MPWTGAGHGRSTPASTPTRTGPPTRGRFAGAPTPPSSTSACGRRRGPSGSPVRWRSRPTPVAPAARRVPPVMLWLASLASPRSADGYRQVVSERGRQPRTRRRVQLRPPGSVGGRRRRGRQPRARTRRHRHPVRHRRRRRPPGPARRHRRRHRAGALGRAARPVDPDGGSVRLAGTTGSRRGIPVDVPSYAEACP